MRRSTQMAESIPNPMFGLDMPVIHRDIHDPFQMRDWKRENQGVKVDSSR
jgi:hypothetical protein